MKTSPKVCKKNYQAGEFISHSRTMPARTLLLLLVSCTCTCMCSGASEGDASSRVEELAALAIQKYVSLGSSPASREALEEFVSNLVRGLASKKSQFSFKENQTEECLHLGKGMAKDPGEFVDLCERALKSQCLSVEELLGLLPSSESKLPLALTSLCPLLLFQSHDASCQSTVTTSKAIKVGKPRPTTGAVWGFGILFVTIISLCSLVGVSLLPLMNKSAYHTVLMLFEGLAVGSLAGSAIFHLIPQAFNLLGQDAEHDYLWKSLIICFGIYLFFMSETVMKIIIEKRKDKKTKVPSSPASMSTSNTNASVNSAVLVNGITFEEPEAGAVQNHVHSHSHHHAALRKNVIGTVAWMIIFGDGLHNFIDGLSIGAAFSESVLSGISISVAVICEEFPHELGDFAVLLSAGMSMKQAVLYNFLSACTCYVGLVFGILLGDLAEGGPYIFALAGGMFLYISLVDMVKELNEGLQEASREGNSQMLKVVLLQNAGILLGAALLFLMARYSEKINFEAFAQNATATDSLLSPHNFFLHEGQAWKVL